MKGYSHEVLDKVEETGDFHTNQSRDDTHEGQPHVEVGME